MATENALTKFANNNVVDFFGTYDWREVAGPLFYLFWLIFMGWIIFVILKYNRIEKILKIILLIVYLIGAVASIGGFFAPAVMSETEASGGGAAAVDGAEPKRKKKGQGNYFGWGPGLLAIHAMAIAMMYLLWPFLGLFRIIDLYSGGKLEGPVLTLLGPAAVVAWLIYQLR